MDYYPLVKDFVTQLPEREKDKLLALLLRKNKEEQKRLYFEFLADEEELEQYLHAIEEEALAEISSAYITRGRAQKNLARGIKKANRLISAQKALFKEQSHKELSMVLAIVSYCVQHYSDELGTHFTTYDSTLARTLSKAITMWKKKIHPDYQVEFLDQLNVCIQVLKKSSNHINTVFDMPERLEI